MGGWGVLVLVALAQFIVILDTTIVNVALPSIQSSFGLSPENLQWVVTAYTPVFGGFLLPGGRLADLFGRKRWFIIAVVLFGLASLVTGLAVSDGMLIAARAVQGLAGALLTPSALSIVLVSYAEGHRSNVALSAWGIVASAGGAVGATGAGDPDRRVHVGCDVLRRWRRDKTAVRQHSLLRSTGTSRRSTSPPLSWWSLPSSPRLYSSRRARRASPRKVRPSG